VVLRILLDVNVLGLGSNAPVTRAGIFRATEQLSRALLRRDDLAVHFAAEATWASELLLLAYDRERGGWLGDRILRAWEQPGISDADATALIAHVVAEEAAGRSARKDRATLTLLSAGARRVGLHEGCDVLHSLRTPLAEPARIAARVRALTIHDVIPLLHPEWMYPAAEAELVATAASVLPSDSVIANSKATARDVSAALGIDSRRVFVTPLAASSDSFYREPSSSRIEAARARYGIPAGPYILSVCTLEPRKNLLHLLSCFHRMLQRESPPDARLVLVGPTGWNVEPLFTYLSERPELAKRVTLAGYVDDADLAALYSGARAFVYPSLYEGFGLPVLEAMQCGTPVITSDCSSLPEVAGEAAILVPPTDEAALESALGRVMTDATLAAELSRRGLERAKAFSWERTAEATVQAYREMLRISSRS